jgi:hypothetical protein
MTTKQALKIEANNTCHLFPILVDEKENQGIKPRRVVAHYQRPTTRPGRAVAR